MRSCTTAWPRSRSYRTTERVRRLSDARRRRPRVRSASAQDGLDGRAIRTSGSPPPVTGRVTNTEGGPGPRPPPSLGDDDMTVTVHPSAATRPTGSAWRGFTGEPWQRRIDVRAFIQANYTPYEGDAAFLAGPTARTPDRVGDRRRPLSRGAPQGCARHRRRDAIHHHLPRPRLHRPRPGADRRIADRRSAEAGDHAQRRAAHGRERAARVRLRTAIGSTDLRCPSVSSPRR